MDSIKSFNACIEKSIKDNWDKDALTDYLGATLQYHDVARKIEKLHILFENSGLKKGDKVALCGRNSSSWAVAFFATLSYGAVAVPVQHEFKPEQIYNIVNHSEAKLLFVGDVVATTIDGKQMPQLEGIIYLPDFSLILSRSESLTIARENLNALFGKKYPKFFRAEDVNYFKDEADDLALINYTSGTTGFSKGVMLSYRSVRSNLAWATADLKPHIKPGSKVLCMLPMAHMYGMICEFICQFSFGSHLYFLTRLPSPSLIAQACTDIRPVIIIAVPMVVEKIIRKNVFPKVQSTATRMLLKMPVVSKKVKERISAIVMEAFGGNAYELVTGGAALNKEIEDFLVSINFPVTSGYGATECGPMVTYSDYKDFVPGSCGTPVLNMEVKIVSPDPVNVPGEVITRGENVMLGYYKNEEATKEVLDKDGWYHTGDLGTMSADGHLFLRGRIKNMLLGSNGQNVYPEEIEDKLNSMSMVSECIVVQRGDKIVGLVYPDFDEAKEMGFLQSDLQEIMEQNRLELNNMLPSFCHLSAIELRDEEFAKTPKKSIKRYLYQEK
ncbi:AMP-binding protein [Prevotella melaninogenica]|uniref:AMP-binding protein n=1 Tax=Prevotella melaninogenica TaxID=28132 RepID=A0ABS6Y4W8_9BACT|nr:AMP-binding protein [Prevotella melaninogenica]MBW4754546.1 AMP-binding protein [Prevotella melaninogenica]